MSPPKRQKSKETQQQLDFTAVLASQPLQKTAYSVSEFTALIDQVLDEDPVLGASVVVQGELSNVKRSSRGHIYFTLKDEEAAISGILWASLASRLGFDLEDGLEVYLTGKLEVYWPHGTYSLVATKLEPVGLGALQLAFEQIKARLEAEGLFMEEYKKDIPEFPERIGIITSKTGAVIHDMLRVIKRKNPMVDVLIAPVKVQGEGAAAEIALAITELNNPAYRLNTLIVARGGGSFEDLFCFSEEAVVRAIFNSEIPVITGIGHEPDYSLADAAADYSASTPTAAADWAVPDAELLLQNHVYRVETLLESMRDILLECEQTLDYSATRMIEQFDFLLDTAIQRQKHQQERFLNQTDSYFKHQSQKLQHYAANLDAFNPLATMARGFSVARTLEGHVVKSIQQVDIGTPLSLAVSDGQIQCAVTGTMPTQQEDLLKGETLT